MRGRGGAQLRVRATEGRQPALGTREFHISKLSSGRGRRIFKKKRKQAVKKQINIFNSILDTELTLKKMLTTGEHIGRTSLIYEQEKISG